MRDRSEEIAAIKAKGFKIAAQKSQDYYNPHTPLEFQNIRINTKQIEDAVLQLGSYKRANPRLGDREEVVKAIADRDLPKLREISNFFYCTSGIYQRILRYMAFMYRYDWFVTPYLEDEKTKKEKLLDGFHKCLYDLDNFGVKKQLGEIALKILRFGCYYGYKMETKDGIVLQELPVNYCRTRFNSGRKPVVEFQMKFFDGVVSDLVHKPATAENISKVNLLLLVRIYPKLICVHPLHMIELLYSIYITHIFTRLKGIIPKLFIFFEFS